MPGGGLGQQGRIRQQNALPEGQGLSARRIRLRLLFQQIGRGLLRQRRQTGGHRRHPHARQGQDPRHAPAQQAGCAPFGCLWFHWHHSRMPSAYAPVDRFRTRPVPKIPKTILPQEVPL